jgi:hypothetical protein
VNEEKLAKQLKPESQIAELAEDVRKADGDYNKITDRLGLSNVIQRYTVVCKRLSFLIKESQSKKDKGSENVLTAYSTAVYITRIAFCEKISNNIIKSRTNKYKDLPSLPDLEAIYNEIRGLQYQAKGPQLKNLVENLMHRVLNNEYKAADNPQAAEGEEQEAQGHPQTTEDKEQEAQPPRSPHTY